MGEAAGSGYVGGISEILVKLAFLATCYYPDAAPIWMLEATARKQGIDLQTYGMGEAAGSWTRMKVEGVLGELPRLREAGFTHVLYTDGRDSLFARGPWHIDLRYELAGAPPCLMSAQRDCWPPREEAAEIQRLLGGFPSAGQWMAEIHWLELRWSWMQRVYAGLLGENDQAWIAQAVLDGKMTGLQLDTGCQIFQAFAHEHPDSDACVLHFNGGYSDPQTGREGRMRPAFEGIMGGGV